MDASESQTTTESKTTNSPSRKIALWLLVIVGIIVIVAASLQISAANTSNSNAAALNSLNYQINQYGANVRYLLNVPPPGYSLPGDIYNSTYNLSYPFAANNVLYLLSGNKSISQPLASGQNWGAHDKSVINLTQTTLFSLGVASPNLPSVANSTDLKNLYLLSLAGKNILLIAQTLGFLFSTKIFAPSNISAPSYLGISAYPNKAGGYYLTSTTAASSLLLLGIVPGWAVLSSDLNSSFEYYAAHGYATANKTGIPIQNMLYVMSLVQYQSHQFYEMLYNQSISPEIEFVGYSRNTLVLNLGNLNLNSNPSVLIRVDNKTLAGAKYLNWVISNVSLQAGLHNVSASIGSTVLLSSLFISPNIYLTHFLSGNKLTIRLGNINYRAYTLNISNINVSASPPYFDLQGALAESTILPAPNTGTRFYLKDNTTAVLNYTISSACSIGNQYVYYLSFDTNLGKAYYVLSGSCI